MYYVDVKISRPRSVRPKETENKHFSGSLTDCLNFLAELATSAEYQVETISGGRVLAQETEASIRDKFRGVQIGNNNVQENRFG